jgi:hypothetical protein
LYPRNAQRHKALYEAETLKIGIFKVASLLSIDYIDARNVPMYSRTITRDERPS